MSPKKTIAAVIVTYNPSDTLVNNILSILKMADKAIIVDNNSNKISFDIIKKCKEKFDKQIETIFNTQNLGVAAALNQGITFALQNNYQWIITLDQDSLFIDNSIEKMYSLANSFSSEIKVGIISPTYLLESSNYQERESLSKDEFKNFKPMLVTMTSGNLISSEVFKKMGLFDEFFFIDYVDFEYCLRLNKCGYHIYQSLEAKLKHSLGTSVRKKFFFNLVSLETANHLPWRIYYKYRNRIITYKRYGLDFPVWTILDILSIPKEIIKINLVNSNRIEYMKSILIGIIHGMKK
jgi:rhamnosyltransferase